MTTPNAGSSSWPANYQGCRFVAHYVDSLGVPVGGTVTFNPTPTKVLDADAGLVIVMRPTTVTLDRTGSLDVVLPASDDPDINPIDWNYQISENFQGGGTFFVDAPMGSTIDLVDVTPVPSADGVPIVRGAKGDPGTTIAPELLAGLAPKGGVIHLPDPSGSAATDSANLRAAIAAILATPSKVGVIQAQAGVYKISGLFRFGDYNSQSGVALLGRGGGSESTLALTLFQCQSADAQFEFTNGGGVSGHFRLDANGIARTPFVRGGGGGSGRTFLQMTVVGKTPTVTDGSGGTDDTAIFWGAQNDLFLQCHFNNADRDLAHFCMGYGGAEFVRCEWSGTIGRYGMIFDEVAPDAYAQFVPYQVYVRCTDLTFNKGIIEGRLYGGNTRIESADLITHRDYVMVSSYAAAKGLYQGISGEGCVLDNSYFLLSPNSDGSLQAGGRAIWLENAFGLVLSGKLQVNQVYYAFSMNGLNCRAYMNATPVYYDVGQVADQAINFLSFAQIADQKSDALRSSVGDPTVPVLLYRRAGGQFSVLEYADGTRHYYPGTGYSNDDVQWGRVAPGVVGVLGHQAIRTGSGSTAERPDAQTVGRGSEWYDTTIGKPIWSNGIVWTDATGAFV